MQDRLLISEWGTARDKPVLPTLLQQGESVETILRIADDPCEAEATGLEMEATLRLMVTDMTGGSHLLAVSWNGSDLETQPLEGERSYTIDLSIPSSSIICGDNTLKLTVASANPGVLSEIRIDDVEVLVTYIATP